MVELDGQPALAVDFKSGARIGKSDTNGLRTLREDYPEIPCLIACGAPEPFALDFVEVLPWSSYLSRLEELLRGGSDDIAERGQLKA